MKILPNLRARLELVPIKTGSVVPDNYRKLTDAAGLSAGLEVWPTNALRHSYASYHLAESQDAATLALGMGHSMKTILFTNYREVVTPEAARQYRNIVPRTQLVPVGVDQMTPETGSPIPVEYPGLNCREGA